ncbi:hypothetical protein AWZ03_006039 [Drosophila navojoa]|uniref:Uncharacterized protein n=1 Tax=Drosophila navojoa TaxID=7232 RepID=A0A484BHU6_DRONA|nr:hypothetical protein AWZ03_006039 [Drosophila navojoa]
MLPNCAIPAHVDFLGEFSSVPSMRRRHHPRGTKRGRPRGSTRRGGGHGSLQRVPTPSSPAVGALMATGKISSPRPQQEAGNAGASGEAASGATVPAHEEDVNRNLSATPGAMGTPATAVVKRGPGRPRSKTATPVSRGTRGAPRARRPMGPLLVPLGRSPDATPPGSSPATSRAPSPTPHGERSAGALD